MSEVPNVSDLTTVKYFIMCSAGFIGVINALIYHIWRALTKKVDEIEKKQDEDHDRLNTIETEHNIYHPKNNSG